MTELIEISVFRANQMALAELRWTLSKAIATNLPMLRRMGWEEMKKCYEMVILVEAPTEQRAFMGRLKNMVGIDQKIHYCLHVVNREWAVVAIGKKQYQ